MKKVHLGDKGTTRIFGKEVSKSDCYVEALGGFDELNSFIGLCKSFNSDELINRILESVQRGIFSIGSEMSSQIAGQKPQTTTTKEMVQFLDQAIVDLEGQLPELTRFIIPDGTQLASLLHVTRAVCRRVETSVSAVNEKVKLNENIIPYVNRLSDVLYDMARYANDKEGVEDVEWKAE